MLMVSYLIHYDTSLQNPQTLLENATTMLLQNKSDVLLRNATILRKNAAVIIKCVDFVTNTTFIRKYVSITMFFETYKFL